MNEQRLREEIHKLDATADRAFYRALERKTKAEEDLEQLEEEYARALLRRSFDAKGAAEEAGKVRERIKTVKVLIEEAEIAIPQLRTYKASCSALNIQLRHLDRKHKTIEESQEKVDEHPGEEKYVEDLREWRDSLNAKREELSRKLEALRKLN